jgi:pyruvate formate lyase activating enzyme
MRDNITATIFDVKRFAVHDGPGIRSTLFLKGCPLDCKWCHNPEGLAPGKQLWYFPNQCLKCGDCVKVCPEGALTLEDEIIINRDKCTNCGACTEECPTGALHFIGRTLTMEEAEEELLKDRSFFEESGGGITLSGGEPLAQFDAAAAILKRMKAARVHTCVETSLYVKREKLEAILSLVDYFLTDLKLIDSAEHQAHAGVKNELILKNLKFLADSGKDMLIRVPVIPGFTDHRKNLEGIAAFIAELSRPLPVELMNFNPLARDKFRVLGRPYEPAGADQPYPEDRMEDFREIFRKKGLEVK